MTTYTSKNLHSPYAKNEQKHRRRKPVKTGYVYKPAHHHPRNNKSLIEFKPFRSDSLLKPAFNFQTSHIVSKYATPVFLENRWCFWFDKYIGPDRTVEEYAAAMINFATVNTVQDFWQWFNNLPSVGAFQPGTSLHLMKEGIKPLWEDESNANGGNLALKVRREDSHQLWLCLLLTIIGEQLGAYLPEDDDICGASVSIRRNESVLCLWNKKAETMNAERMLGHIAHFLPSDKVHTPQYRVHRTNSNFTTSH